MARLLGIAIVLAVALPAAPADTLPTQRLVWIVSFGGEELGRETMTAKPGKQGWLIESEGGLPSLGTTSFEQRLLVDSETLDCLEYRLRAETAGGTQTVEAERTDEGLAFKALVGGEQIDRKGKGDAPMLCLDNVVLAHYSVLAQAAVRRGTEPFTFTAAVPSVMRTFPAKLDPSIAVKVRIGETLHDAREARIEVAGVLTLFRYDAANGTPYSVEVPSQEFEAHVEGWAGVVERTEPKVVSPHDGAGTESEVAFSSSLGEVSGTFTVPGDASGPFPVVVLLPGSGPNDRDETIGPNKPFRDIAHGLAANGVASLRFDKRKTVGARIIENLEEEYIEDAVAAVAYARQHDAARSDAVFLLGHSLGGLAAPIAAKRADGLRGVILMAAAGRRYDILLKEQLVFQAGVTGLSEEEAKATTEEQLAPLHAMLADDANNTPFLGASATYWRDLVGHNPLAVTGAIDHPVLVLQGEKDIQIRVGDYQRLKGVLSARESGSVEAQLFPELNHLFMQTDGESTGAEYHLPGFVDPTVTRTIGDWIHATAKAP